MTTSILTKHRSRRSLEGARRSHHIPFLDSIRDRNTARSLSKTLERELSSYTSPSERDELNAILERSSGNVSDLLRAVDSTRSRIA